MVNFQELLDNKSLLIVDMVIIHIKLPNNYNASKLISIYQNIIAPIIVISSMNKYDGIYFTKKIDGESFFQKPFDYRDIINEVNNLFKYYHVNKSKTN